MGGRGTYAADIDAPYTYKTVATVDGIKVLENIEGKHKLPEESHSSSKYALLNRDGTLKVLRIYDKQHYLRLEIALHNEATLTKKHGLPRGEPVLHYHTYTRKFGRSEAKLLTQKMQDRYASLFKRRWR